MKFCKTIDPRRRNFGAENAKKKQSFEMKALQQIAKRISKVMRFNVF